MKKMLLVMLAAVVMLSMAACSQYAMSADFDEEEVVAYAQKIVGLLNQRDYQGVTEEFRADVQQQVTADYLDSQLTAMLDKMGGFVEFAEFATAGYDDKDSGEECAVIVMKAKYENSKAQYTMYIDKNMQLIGLYLK